MLAAQHGKAQRNGIKLTDAEAMDEVTADASEMFHNFSDVKQQQDIKTEIPKMKTGSRITVECDPSEFQFEYMKQLAERANAAKSSGRGDNKSDNMLKIYGDGKKIAYSQKAIDPSLPYEVDGKIAKCAENVARIYNETGEQKGAQIVFCDYGVPTSTDVVTDENATTNETENASGAQIYSEIKRRLVAFGIPAEQVAFAHDAKTDDQKSELYKKVNEGIVRVIIGSTGKIGVGVNMQKRIAAMHHLDAPQRPGDIEQREGRGLRWGNMFSEVGVYTYITKKTFDARLWDDLRRKATFIHQIMSGTFNGREVEGDGDFAVSAAEISALATGNPLILEQHLVNNKILALEAQKSSQRSMAISAGVEYDKLSTRIKEARVINENLRKDIAAKTDVSGDRFSIEIKGRIYGKREAAGDAVIAAAKKLLAERGKNEPGKTAEIGKFAGFTLLVDDNLETLVRGAGTYAAQVNPESAVGTIRSLESVVGDSLQKRLARSEAAVEQWKKDLVTLQQTANSTFQSQEELDALYDRRAEIEKELSGGESASEQYSLRDDENSIDNWKPEDYNNIRISSDEHGKLYHEAMTWHADKVNVPFKTTVNGTIYYCQFDSHHSLTIFTSEPEYNIHERGSRIHDKQNGRYAYRSISEIEDARRVNSGDMLHSENRQENGTNGRYAAGEVSAERRSDRGRYRENGSNDSRAKESEVEQAYELSDSDVHYSLREKDPPENTMVGYKVFVAKNGQLYPPMVANPDGAGTPVGVWLDADEGATAKNADGTDKTNTLGRLKVKAGGKGTAGGSGDLAYRPGWHLGEVPLAPQFYETDKITGEKVQHPNFVWAECEFAADVNYQEEAMSYGYTASGKFQHSLAGLPKIPVDGYYTYRTNPNPDTVPWYITGAMKVTKLLGDEETDSILNKMGVVPMKRAGGPIDLAKLGFTQTQFSDRDPEERTNREILADAFESGVARTTAEKTLISDYRGAIKSIDKAENDLREVNAKIKELSFAEGQRDNAKLAELHQKAGELQSKVTWWDKRLLTLEASAPLKAVLESEKKRVRKEWQQKGRERVEAYRQARNDTKTRQQLRAYIKHSVKRLDNMFRHPTDAAHIPAELRDAIADFMQPFLDEETTDAGNTSVFRAETLRAAREAYESLGEGENELSDVYDEDTAARLAELSKTMDGRRLAELSAVELSELKKVVQHFAHLASDGNKAFVAGKMESIGNLAEGVISAANERGRKESVKGTDNAFTRMLTTEMMTPSYFFKHIGGNMQTLYNDLLIGGQKTFSEDVQSSRAFLLETADKYHYWQWADTNEKNKNDKLAMTNSIGQKITLTRETALGLYATYMRELSGNDQNAKHLTAGGFVYSEIQENTGGKIARTYQDRTAHPMSAEDKTKRIRCAGHGGSGDQRRGEAVRGGRH